MFADMPLDNRTVENFAARPRSLAFLGRLKPHRRGDDLMFRRGCLFCNIETNICQYD